MQRPQFKWQQCEWLQPNSWLHHSCDHRQSLWDLINCESHLDFREVQVDEVAEKASETMKHGTRSLQESSFCCWDKLAIYITQRKRGLSGLMVTEDLWCGRLVPRPEHHGKCAWWRTPAQCMATRNQEERKEPEGREGSKNIKVTPPMTYFLQLSPPASSPTINSSVC